MNLKVLASDTASRCRGKWWNARDAKAFEVHRSFGAEGASQDDRGLVDGSRLVVGQFNSGTDFTPACLRRSAVHSDSISTRPAQPVV